MSAFPVINPFPLFEGIDGLPLNDGYVYVGVNGGDPETNPIQVYSDIALSNPLDQPLRTQGGYIFDGSAPINVYAGTSPYSIRVRAKNLSEVFYRASVSNGVIQSTTGISIENESNSGNAVVIPNADAYSGIGTATMGAPRTIWGTNTPSGDDACFLVCRNVVGQSLFSHAFRDETDVVSNLDSAYTSMDLSYTLNTNSGAKYNHSYGCEWRAIMNAANGINVFAGYQTSPVIQQGNVDVLHHFRATNVTISGGGIGSEHAGYVCEILSGGTGTNFAFIARGNPSALLGDLQIAGHIVGATDITASGQFAASDGNFTGPLVAYLTGGLAVAGERYSAGYASVEGYEDNTGAPRGLVLNGNGGQVLVAKGAPVTGALLEVGGSFSCDGPVGFNGTTPPNKPTITGSRGGNDALQNLLLALQGTGLLTDSTSA